METEGLKQNSHKEAQGQEVALPCLTEGHVRLILGKVYQQPEINAVTDILICFYPLATALEQT